MENTIFIDTETTGLNGKDVALEIGICDINENILFNQRIKPRFKRKWPGAERIHHISPADVKNCPSYIEIEPELIEIIRGKKIVMFNSEFDMEKLYQTARCYKHSKIKWLGIADRCCMTMASEKWPESTNYYCNISLANAAINAGVENERSHSAIHDAITTARVYKYLLENPPTDEQKYAFNHKYYTAHNCDYLA